jgi:transketolase
MGAIVNGMTLHKLRTYGATFLIFSDYMKASIRLAAIMRIPSIFVYTHDSIGVGEDGPTHQPIEQLIGLRAIPNLYVVRPADANETALAWRYAVSRSDHPTLMAFSRQGAATLDPESVPSDAIERGAYVLRDSDGDPQVILIATGTEVTIALEAADLLTGDGVAVRVVSMPCMDSFQEQDQAYQDSVLPPSCRARVSIEASSVMGWERWVTEDGDSVGMTTFGASGPQPAVYEHFGFTPEKVAERAKAVLAKAS